MKGQFVEVIKRKIPLDHMGGASLRYVAYTCICIASSCTQLQGMSLEETVMYM